MYVNMQQIDSLCQWLLLERPKRLSVDLYFKKYFLAHTVNPTCIILAGTDRYEIYSCSFRHTPFYGIFLFIFSYKYLHLLYQRYCMFFYTRPCMNAFFASG